MVVKGGSFLINEPDSKNSFTPEDFTDEQKMIGKTAENFVEGEVAPLLERLEAQEQGLMRQCLEKAGELGLLSADIAEEYEGMGLDKISSIIITEKIVKGGAFSLAQGAHTGIGSLPIVFYGNEEQKKKYLPGLASGEKIAAYCLTEPGSGSDALAAKTKAVLSDDGKYYTINGTKQYITNAGMADVFVTYAKVDGDKFTGFIIDRDLEGVSLGAEEKKMGIKGSSTRSVILDDVKVPVENVLGEVGKGHIIAFNILNIGRYKLAGGTMGAAKVAIEEAVNYALERQQFNTPIANFGLIREKIAKMATMTYVSESMVYKTAGLIDESLAQVDMKAEDAGVKTSNAIAEYAIECSINKVHGSEVLDFVADEAVQIHGGYGYTSEYPVERIYRDSRINRIFEGTNEINRLLIPATLLRKAMKGELPLLQEAQKVGKEIMEMMPEQPGDGLLEVEKKKLAMAKKILLMTAGVAAQKFGTDLKDQQQILGNLADIIIEVFAMECALARAEKNCSDENDLKVKMTRYYCNLTFPKIEGWAKQILAATETGDTLRTQLVALRKLTRFDPENLVEQAEGIAAEIIEAKKYTC
ncbi:hypothetical protein GGQ84_002745 [Desulfitispora alkaliphila]|uniref:acyl-CoA dehydrogenase family protein n=1 Tax=Desulfitispora alkaliphila TaxID=622674 RepID=UPI003D1C8FB6